MQNAKEFMVHFQIIKFLQYFYSNIIELLKRPFIVIAIPAL